MKEAIVRWPISTTSIGGLVLAIGLAIIVTPFLHIQGKQLASFESVYLGAIVALVRIGLAIYGVAKKAKSGKALC